MVGWTDLKRWHGSRLEKRDGIGPVRIGNEAKVKHVVALAVAKVILVMIAWFDDEDLAVGDTELRVVQLAAIGPALNQDQLVVRMRVRRILVVTLHSQQMEVIEDGMHTDTRLHQDGPAKSFLDHGHGAGRLPTYPGCANSFMRQDPT